MYQHHYRGYRDTWLERKGQGYMLSAVLYMAIFITGVVIVYNVATPKVQEIIFKSKYEDTKNEIIKLNNAILEVASQAEGAMKTLSLSIREGMLIINTSYNKIIWKVKGEKRLMGLPASAPEEMSIRYGNGATLTKYSNYYILENDKLIVNISDNGGSASNPKDINISQLITRIYNKKEDSTLSIPFRILINDDPSMEVGKGYIKVNEDDLRRGKATLLVHVSNDISSYVLSISLEGGADFLTLHLL